MNKSLFDNITLIENFTKIDIQPNGVSLACIEQAKQMYDSYFLQELYTTRIFLAICIVIIAIFYFRIQYLKKKALAD